MSPERLRTELDIRTQAMTLHHELVNEAFLNSIGSDDMSLTDAKSALVSLWRLVQFQDQLITKVYEYLTPAPTKPWYKRIFNK